MRRDQYFGLVNSDTDAVVTTPPALATAAQADSHVSASPYAITAAGAAASADYTISYAAGALTVTPAPLFVFADSKTKLYGAPLPTLTASYLGFVNGDDAASLTKQPDFLTTAMPDSHVADGPFAIIASGAADADYTFTYAPGFLTVAPATLTVTAGDKSKVYGDPLPGFTAAITGLVNGDAEADIVRNLRFTSDARPSSPVSDSPYAIHALAEASRDYTVATHDGELTVTKAPTAIALDPAPSGAVSGQTVTLTATVTATNGAPAPAEGTVTFFDGDTPLGTAPVHVGGVATLDVALPAGNYHVTAAYSGSANYEDPDSTEPVVLDVSPVDTPNERYVRAVYLDVLGRETEPGGLEFWSQQLDGGAALDGVAHSITHSDEYYANFVIKPVFQALLDRLPEPDELADWTTAMQAGLTRQQLEAQLAASDEKSGVWERPPM